MNKFKKIRIWKKRLYLYSGVLLAIFVAPYLLIEGGSTTKNPVKTELEGYPESESHEMCIEAIRASVNNPSTLEIHSLMGYGTNVNDSGTRRITQTFSAKNAFGLQQTYDAYCEISPQGELIFHIREQGR